MLSHCELHKIYNVLFAEEIKDGISEFFEQDMDNEEYYYKTEILWKTDSIIDNMK